jgi:hypothetical protein
MKDKKILYSSLLCLFVLLFPIGAGYANTLEYKVKIGDTIVYEVILLNSIGVSIEEYNQFAKFSQAAREDGTNISLKKLTQYAKEDGTNITLKKDDKFTVEITSVSNSAISAKITSNDETSKEVDFSEMVLKTSNKSYWETLEGTTKEDISVSLYTVWDLGTVVSTLDGDLFIQELSFTLHDTFNENTFSFQSTTKMNMNTGWIEYIHKKFSISGERAGNHSGEVKIEKVGGSGGISGFEIVPLLFALILGSIIIKRRK